MELKLTDEQIKEIFKSMTCEEINNLRDEVKEKYIKPLYKVGDILLTDNGDFMIVRLEISNPRLYSYGAMYLTNDEDSPYEIQYMNEDFNELIKEIERDGIIVASRQAMINY